MHRRALWIQEGFFCVFTVLRFFFVFLLLSSNRRRGRGLRLSRSHAIIPIIVVLDTCSCAKCVQDYVKTSRWRGTELAGVELQTSF